MTNINPTLTRVLCIDPSTRALGWAIFEARDTIGHDGVFTQHSAKLTMWGALKQRGGTIAGEDGGDAWIRRLDAMVADLRSLQAKFQCDVVLIEQPDHYSSGRGEAAKNSSAILKLIALVFAARQALTDDGDGEVAVILVPVRKWKGTVPKEITQRRVFVHWGWAGRIITRPMQWGSVTGGFERSRSTP